MHARQEKKKVSRKKAGVGARDTSGRNHLHVGSCGVFAVPHAPSRRQLWFDFPVRKHHLTARWQRNSEWSGELLEEALARSCDLVSETQPT